MARRPHISIDEAPNLDGLSRDEKVIRLWGHGFTTRQIAMLLSCPSIRVTTDVRRLRDAGHDLPRRLGVSEPEPPIENAPDQLQQLSYRDIELPKVGAFRSKTCTYVIQMRSLGVELLYCDQPTEGHPSYCPVHQETCLEKTRRIKAPLDPNLVPAGRFGSLGCMS